MKRAIVLLLPLLLAAPATARAFTVGVDVYGAWLQNSSGRDGVGANLRLGQGIDLPGVDLQLEIGGTYAAFASGPLDSTDRILGGFGGARLGVGELVRPALFAHLGFAEFDHPVLVGGGSSGAAGSGSGPFARVGLALDLVLPIVSAGVDVAYDSFLSGDFSGGDAPAWITAGVHAALTF